jgi:hypothetical protein
MPCMVEYFRSEGGRFTSGVVFVAAVMFVIVC